MSTQETAATLLQACQDEANGLLLLAGLDGGDRLLAKHRNLVEAAMHAGIAGTLTALQREGYLPEATA